jgi:hypothetical protein
VSCCYTSRIHGSMLMATDAILFTMSSPGSRIFLPVHHAQQHSSATSVDFPPTSTTSSSHNLSSISTATKPHSKRSFFYCGWMYQDGVVRWLAVESFAMKKMMYWTEKALQSFPVNRHENSSQGYGVRMSRYTQVYGRNLWTKLVRACRRLASLTLHRGHL